MAVFACDPGDDGDEEDDNQFREDVIQCEEAIARLERCCPEFDGSRVLCNYYFRHDASVCGPSTTESVQPALSLAESGCVREASCERLVADGVCERAQAATTYQSRRVHDGDASLDQDQSHPLVCP